MNSVIEIRNCTASYDGSDVLHDVSLTVEKGEFLTIIGPSGCGKTTLLKMVNGLVTPAQGEVFINGGPLADCSLTALRRRIGYAVQGLSFFLI